MFNFSDQTLLVVAPHPDDEVLGCTGLIKRIKESGGKVYILFLTVGDTNDYSKKGISKEQERINEIKNVSNFLKYDGWRIVYPGNKYHLQLDTISLKDIINEIEKGEKISLNSIKPTIVSTTRLTDYNQDHRICAQAVFAAARPIPGGVKPLQNIILEYESVFTAEWWNSFQKNPNFFIELSDNDIETKIKALKLYDSQVREKKHQRSPQGIKTIACLRGVQCGTGAAEAYFCNRFVV